MHDNFTSFHQHRVLAMQQNHIYGLSYCKEIFICAAQQGQVHWNRNNCPSLATICALQATLSREAIIISEDVLNTKTTSTCSEKCVLLTEVLVF